MADDVNLSNYAGEVAAALDDLNQRDTVGRMWRKDHTVWNPEPVEITNRLGWLSVTELMSEQVPALESFAREIKDAGFRHVVVLGMGGSSLGPEVLRQTFGNAVGYPALIVLDSTVPSWIKSVTESIDPARTLFLISSKSGTTTEPLVLFRYFKNLVEESLGTGKAGQNFAAVTDPGTPLVKLGEDEGFRHVFLNPSDIGGRYSVLSYFGLVPAVLTGIDIKTLLDRSDGMRKACGSHVPVHDNPGTWLGALMGTISLKGRDKLTLVTSPAIAGFGLWVEQLIAESTGKDGKGIIPVAGEPLMEPARYGDDRLFVCLRLHGDDNSEIDKTIERISPSEHPVLTLNLGDKYDLGAEFYRWEFATAIAGAILGIHPFNQPNVQQAKNATERILQEYTTSGNLPTIKTTGSISELLTGAAKGKYLAIMAYLRETTETDKALTELRRKVVERYGIATTIGYGPRFLHSTGQLHKGGPDTGLFLQITAGHKTDIPIPDMPYTFGVVADAQAAGDLQALQSSERDVVMVHLTADDYLDLGKLVTENL
ncbi:glucose-6-phosphate isomerase [Chloroflexota bacterium]